MRDYGLLESALARPQAYRLIVSVAAGEIDDVATIASVLAEGTEQVR